MRGGRGTNVHVGGNVLGQLVVGDHNITVWAEQSVVTVVAPGDRPKPRLRPVIKLLPRQPARPVGRDRDLEVLRGTFKTSRVLQVYGPPGVGKSTLIRYLSGEIVTSGTSTVFLRAANRSVDDVLQDIFEACFDSLGYRPTPVELRRLMSGVNFQLLIDDLDLPADQIDTLLDGVCDATVVFTSLRRSLWADGDAIKISGLGWAPTLELLTAALNRPLREQELPAVVELWHAAAGSPLLLLRAAANARRAHDGTLTLPRAAELAELLPQVITSLNPLARDATLILAAANAPVSTVLLPWLVAAGAADLGGAMRELIWRRIVIVSDQGYELAPGVAAQLPTEVRSSLQQVEWIAGRLRQCSRQLPPPLMAAHVTLITCIINAAISFGRPDIGALLAKDIAPVVACSGRLDAWQQILEQGRAAAEFAGDRATLAYLMHEDGVHALVTGKQVAAAAAIGAAIALWQQLGYTTHALVAQQANHLIGSTAAAQLGAATTTAAPAATSQASTALASASSKAAVTAGKVGLSVAAKIAVAGIAGVVIATGGYLAVTAGHISSSSTAPSTQVSTPQSTGSGPSEQRSETTSPAKGAVPDTCPTESFLGPFIGRDPSTEAKEPGSIVCVYKKGSRELRLILSSRPNEPAWRSPGEELEVTGAGPSWVSPPYLGEKVRSMVVNLGGRSIYMEFIGTVEDAVAAAKRILDLD